MTPSEMLKIVNPNLYDLPLVVRDAFSLSQRVYLYPIHSVVIKNGRIELILKGPGQWIRDE